jgi:hypothetical protein
LRTFIYVVLGCIGGMLAAFLLICVKALSKAGIELIFPNSDADLILGSIVLGLIVVYFIWWKLLS